MTAERWRDVAVVGAGPSGSTVATLLARRGWDVLLLDRSRFPRPKPCGECLNPGAVDALRRLDLLDRVTGLEPAPIEGWRVEAEGGTAAFGRLPGDGGLGVPRPELDEALLGAARSAGAEIREGTRATMRSTGSDRGPATLTLRPRTGIPCRVNAHFAIAADGLRSPTAVALGLVRPRTGREKASVTFRLRGRGPSRRFGRLRVDASGTLGLAPVHGTDPLWNGTLVVDPKRWGRALAEDAGGLLLERLREGGIRWEEGPQLVAGPWGSGRFHRTVSTPARGRWLLVGDAAGYYDPLTGQGIYRALRSAELAADAVDRGLRESDLRPVTAYARRLRRELHGPRRVQRVIEGVLSRDALRRRALSRPAAEGGSLDPLLAVTGDAAPVRSLLRPRALLRLAGLSPSSKSANRP